MTRVSQLRQCPWWRRSQNWKQRKLVCRHANIFDSADNFQRESSKKGLFDLTIPFNGGPSPNLRENQNKTLKIRSMRINPLLFIHREPTELHRKSYIHALCTAQNSERDIAIVMRGARVLFPTVSLSQSISPFQCMQMSVAHEPEHRHRFKLRRTCNK